MDAISAPAPARVWEIYKITCCVNEKVYIGQTGKGASFRFQEHCSLHSRCTKLRKAMDRYGRDRFSIEVLCTTTSQEAAHDLEQLLIREYDSINSGYNILPGGQGGRLAKCTRGHADDLRGSGRHCRECRFLYQLEYGKKTRAKKVAERIKFYEQNREKCLAQIREAYFANHEQRLLYAKSYREKNREKVLKSMRRSNARRLAREKLIPELFADIRARFNG